MSKRKWVLLGVTVFLVIAVSISVVSADSIFKLLDFEKMEGIKQVQEGVLVDLPTARDKQKVVDSIDPITGGPTLKLEPKAGDKPVFTKHFTIEGSNKTLDAPYIIENNKEILIYDPITTLWRIPIPNTKEYIIPFDGTIYKTDMDNNRLVKVLKDEVGGYKIDEVLAYKGTPLWGAYPSLNPSGTYMLFLTERCMIDSNKNAETWVKNMITGDEWVVLDTGSSVIGWIDDTTVILSAAQIFSLNVETGEKKTLIVNNNGATDAVVVKDQLVYQTNIGTLTLQSINTGEITTVSSPLIYRCSFEVQGSWIAMLNQVRPSDSEFSVVLYNVDSKVWKEIKAPSNTWIHGVTWKDDSTLHIITSIKGTQEESTYVVKIDEVEVAK